MNNLSRRQFGQKSAAVCSPLLAAGLLASAQSVVAQSAPLKRIRVGQIGTMHGHADGKMQAVRRLKDTFEVVGVVEEDAGQRERAKANPTYSDVPWMTMEQLLNVVDLQLVLVETDIDQLLPTAERCLLAGKHIHLDKPAGTSLDHFRRIATLASEKRLLIQMGYMFRSNPAFQFLYQAIAKGWLGEIFEIDCVMSKKVGPSERAPLARYLGGSMFELGCHLIDSVIRMMGKPDRIIPFNVKSGSDNDQLRDNCLAVFQYPKATATIRSSVIEVEGNARRQMVVCGTQGTLAIKPLEPPQLSLTLDRNQGEFRKGTQVVEMPKGQNRYDAELLSLAKAIRGESVFEYSIEHDLLVQACVLQASEMS